MKNIKIVALLVVLILFCSYLSAQSQLPDFWGFIYHWQQAGHQGDIPIEDETIDVTNHNEPEIPLAVGDGITDDTDAIQDAIDFAFFKINEPGSIINNYAVYLPEGIYLVKDQINMKSGVILKGDGSDKTEIKVYIDANNVKEPADWDENGIEFNGVSNAGVEDIKIKRYDYFVFPFPTLGGNEGHNIYIRTNSSNCWVIGVESDNSLHHLVMIRSSDNNFISGCYIHHPQTHGEGGEGYGVAIYENSKYNLVENNIFRDCRHSMLLQNSSKWNVFGYNYSREPHQCGGWGGLLANSNFTGDMVCHGVTDGFVGEGPTQNLFEGNIGRWIWVDGWHEYNGSWNTFIRNRASRYGLHIYGGLLFPDQLWQGLINNYFRCKRWFASQMGHGRKISTDFDPEEKNSRVKKRNFWGQYYTRWWSDCTYKRYYEAVWNSEISYYYESQPEFMTTTWPFHPYNDDYNPAKWRWYYSASKTASRRFDNNYTEITIWDEDLDISSDFTVAKGECLIIESGVTITFDDDAKLKIKGSLFANGEENAPITFTKRENDNYWDGIQFGGDGEYYNSSEMKNCVIEYGKKTRGGGIYVENYNNLSIESCHMRFNKATSIAFSK